MKKVIKILNDKIFTNDDSRTQKCVMMIQEYRKCFVT